jgi:hypothetical protein
MRDPVTPVVVSATYMPPVEAGDGPALRRMALSFISTTWELTMV